MQYRYVKKSFVKNKIYLQIIPVLLLLSGIGLILSTIGPILYYQFFNSPRFSEIVSPLPKTKVLASATEGLVDYSKASNWFPKAPKLPTLASKITHYNISIPKLGVKEAIVEIGGDDLKKSLIHYDGTAYPGQNGTSVVFGHSALPQFFSATNYSTIFTTLTNLRKNDEIFVNFDGVNYKYIVYDLAEVSPTDISILQQNEEDSFLFLVTCVPPGTYLKRLVIKSKIKSF